MSDAAEKPFEPTPHRLLKAKREGNVARSSELSANLSFLVAGATVVATVPLIGAVASAQLVASLAGVKPQCAYILAVALLPVAGAAAAGAVAAILQGGGLTMTGVAPKIERLNPARGFGRMLSRETVAHSARAAIAFACAALAMLPAIATTGGAMLRAPGFGAVAGAAWKGSQEVAAAAAAVGLFFSLAEYGSARTVWLRKLRMSFEERRREAKDDEGDTVARGRRRALHRVLLRSGLRRVHDAAFVVANPSHVTVALEYRPPAVQVPRILVRAAGELALRVRRIARERGIPVVENVALARALYRDGRAGEPIPHAHYVAVAEVVVALQRALERTG